MSVNRYLVVVGVFLAAITVSFGCLASSVWIVGSFKTMEIASQEQARLAQWLNFEPSIVMAEVGGQPRLRLQVDEGDMTAELITLLRSKGVKPWRTAKRSLKVVIQNSGSQMIATQNIQQESGLKYLLLGRSTNVTQALEFERRVSESFQGVQTDAIIETGQVWHRTFLGPVANQEVEDWKQTVKEAGFEVLAVHLGDDVELSSTTQQGVLVRKQVADKSDVHGQVEVKTAKPKGFNLATLPDQNPPLPVVP